MGKLLIIGAGGHGRVIADTALESQQWEDICFLDDRSNLNNVSYKILGKVDQLPKFVAAFEVVVGIGDNKRREQVLLWARDIGCRISTIIHSKAFVSRYANINQGVVIFANSVVNSNAIIGFGSIVNTGAIVEHDCILDSCVHVSPNVALAGGAKVGKYSWIGIGSSVIENTKIGMNTIIGAGSVVVNDIGDDVVAVGNPARVIKNNEK